MCWRIVLLENKHVSSNAADLWLRLLHQQHVSVILPVDFCSMLNEDELGTAELGYCKIQNSACIEYQSAIRTSFGSVLLRHGLNFAQRGETQHYLLSDEKFCILQGSAVTFFRCGGKGGTVCFLLR